MIISLLATTFSLLNYSNNQDVFVIPNGTKFIAHRGLSSIHYQNSEEAFLGAAQSDYFFGIETDVWQTKDGIWVCCHDINPFNDLSININDITYDEAKTLPLKDSASEVYICSFERYLHICKDYDKMPVIELKQVFLYNQIENLVDFVQRIIALERVMFISFQTANVNVLKEIDFSLRVQTLTSNALGAKLLIKNAKDVGINQNIISPSIIEIAKEKGVSINVWTVNDASKVALYIEWGVDYITSDFIF